MFPEDLKNIGDHGRTETPRPIGGAIVHTEGEKDWFDRAVDWIASWGGRKSVKDGEKKPSDTPKTK